MTTDLERDLSAEFSDLLSRLGYPGVDAAMIRRALRQYLEQLARRRAYVRATKADPAKREEFLRKKREDRARRAKLGPLREFQKRPLVLGSLGGAPRRPSRGELGSD